MKLNECQRQLVEKNHNLIYSFARKNKLDLDEWYDVLALALCRTALFFDATRGKFSTLFYLTANNFVLQIYRRQNAAKRVPMSVCQSLEAITAENDNGSVLTVSDTVVDFDSNFDEYLEIQDVLNRVLDNLSDRNRDIFNAVLDGDTQMEIAKRFGIGQPTVARIVKSVRNTIRENLK